ncbi:putative quinol monooxygenase [Streptomyces sp. NPDC006458]|uniref:putative quinol monooxygenase n=1 Tax=Streptomyces sp. NPDC006458 TaxID=3154302 RepID=UPI0033AAA3B8
MYTIAVSFTVPPERRQDFIDSALEDGRRSTADEPGTLAFDLIADPENPDRFYLYEAYADEAAFQTHCDGEHFATFFKAISEYADGPTWLMRGSRVEQPPAAA